MSNGKDLVTKYNTVKDWFLKDEVKRQLQNVVPAHVSADRLLRHALTTLTDNPELLKCSMKSLVSCIMGGMQLGLSFEKTLGQAYLVPFMNRKSNEYESQLIVGYKGYITLARNSGQVATVSGHSVYDKDVFTIRFGTDETLEHIPAEGDRGTFKGAYCVFFYKDGTKSFDYLEKARIDAVRERSKAGNSGPWVTDYEEMAVKTVIRHHIKLVPLSVEMARAAALEEKAILGETQLDILPPTETPAEKISTSAPEITAAIPFDKLLLDACSKSNVTVGEVMQDMKKFLEMVATQNKVEIKAVMGEAERDWDKFWVKFNDWKNKKKRPGRPPAQKPDSPPQSAASKEDVQDPPMPEESGTLFEDKIKGRTMASCPEKMKQVTVEECRVCILKDGCPAWN